jgi:hypothetical protein
MSKSTILAAALCASLGASAANAGVILDQASMPETGPTTSLGGFSLLPGLMFGQTFTAGMTGLLARVDLGIFYNKRRQGPGGFWVTLEQTPGVALASRHVNYSDAVFQDLPDFEDFTQLNFAPAGIHVVSGQSYRIILKVDSNTPMPAAAAWLDFANGSIVNYAAGTALLYNSLGEQPQRSFDFGFRTYLASVPEPATWAFMILGLGATGAALRRRTTSAATPTSAQR